MTTPDQMFDAWCKILCFSGDGCSACMDDACARAKREHGDIVRMLISVADQAGWQLAPKEATEEMEAAGAAADTTSPSALLRHRRIFAAMAAAAPKVGE